MPNLSNRISSKNKPAKPNLLHHPPTTGEEKLRLRLLLLHLLPRPALSALNTRVVVQAADGVLPLHHLPLVKPRPNLMKEHLPPLPESLRRHAKGSVRLHPLRMLVNSPMRPVQRLQPDHERHQVLIPDHHRRHDLRKLLWTTGRHVSGFRRLFQGTAKFQLRQHRPVGHPQGPRLLRPVQLARLHHLRFLLKYPMHRGLHLRRQGAQFPDLRRRRLPYPVHHGLLPLHLPLRPLPRPLRQRDQQLPDHLRPLRPLRQLQALQRLRPLPHQHRDPPLHQLPRLPHLFLPLQEPVRRHQHLPLLAAVLPRLHPLRAGHHHCPNLVEVGTT